jgi:hypothetical protein
MVCPRCDAEVDVSALSVAPGLPDVIVVSQAGHACGEQQVQASVLAAVPDLDRPR